MQAFEIDESKDTDEALVGQPNSLKTLPFQSITKRIKASVLKRRAQVMIIAFPIIFFAVSSVFSGFQIYWTSVFNTDHPYTTISQVLFRLHNINCDSPMITDIKVISADHKCDADYQDKGIGVWNGTVAGCYSPSTRNVSRNLCPGTPNSISQQPSAILHQWKGSKFCMKTVPAYSSIQKNPLNPNIPPNCLAEPLNIYLPDGHNCPISDLRIISQENSVPQGYKSQSLPDGRLLIFATNYNDTRRLVEINTELYSKPCLNPKFSPSRSVNLMYPLSRKAENGCGEYGPDDDAVELDKIGLVALYQENGLNNLTKKLALWETYNNNKDIVLFAKFRDGLLHLPACNFCNPEYSLIPTAEQLIISEEDMSTYVMITGFLLVFQILLVSYNIAKYIDHNGDYQALFADVRSTNVVFYMVNVFYFAIQIIISAGDYKRLRGSTEKLHWIEQLNCFQNPKLNQLFDTIQGNILDNSWDVLQDCFKAELIAIIFAAGFLLAYKLDKSIGKKDPESLETNFTVQQNNKVQVRTENPQKTEVTGSSEEKEKV